jgi:hypothetical protein
MQKRRKWAAFLETLGQRRATINKVYSKQKSVLATRACQSTQGNAVGA